MQIVAIANQKGGVGKTPTTVNLGYALARAGKRVLLVDLDPQGSLSEYFLVEQAEAQDTTIYNALIDIKRIEPFVINDRVHLLPAHDELSAAELELPSKPNAQKRLAKVLSFYQYDFCLVDCPPNLGIFTVNALAAAHQVLIPSKTELSSERTIKLIMRTIADVQQSDLNAGLIIWGILPTLFNSRKAHHNEVLLAMKYKHGEKVYQEPSKETTRYNDAFTARTDVSVFDKELGKYWDRIAATFLAERSVRPS